VLYGGLNASGYIPASTGERWLILFPDGVFGWHYPEQGFEGFQREAAMQKNPTGWGQYRIDGNRIALHYRTGEVVEGGFDANGTLKIHNVAWLAPWPALDGIRLEGTYARPGSPPVVFDRNGTFTNYGAFTSIIDLDAYGQIVNQEIPQGVGQYRIAQNTLTLAFPTGGVVRMAIFTHQSHTGVAHPDAIMLRGYRYSRAQ
jgi:hypothetical protein